MTFIDKIVDHTLKKYRNNLQDICIVVPSLRSKRHIATKMEKSMKPPFIMPEILSAEEFIIDMHRHIKPVMLVDKFVLTLYLYKTHLNIKGDENNPEDFLEFDKRSKIILKDFNEIDMYMTDTKLFFTYLSNEKALSLWNVDNKELTKYQTDYLHFFNSLSDYHKNLKDILLQNGLAYPGMAYRNVAENIEEITQNIKWDKIVFAGFNALSKAEKVIMKHLYDNNLADMSWDCDKYYFNDLNQEAGYFLRQNAKLFPSSFEEDDMEDGFAEEKNIHVIKSPGKIQQAMIAGNILDENDFQHDKTAIVLADEKMLLPVLGYIPKKHKTINVTLKAPILQNHIYLFFCNIATLHKTDNVDAKGFNSDDFSTIINNTYFKSLVNDEEVLSQLKKISFKTYITTADIDEFAGENEILKLLFGKHHSARQLIATIVTIIEKMSSIFMTEDEPENLFSLQTIKDFFLEYKSYIETFSYLDDLRIFSVVVNQTSFENDIYIQSEPLEGIQVQGILETRLLDFDNVIMISANEDSIPKNESSDSFITLSMRTDFKLPTIYEKNAIYSYHFYRLIQRAKNVFLIYNGDETFNNNGEPSRYISQLKYELPIYAPQHAHIFEDIYNNPETQNKTVSEPQPIEKNEHVLNLIDTYMSHGLSISALNKYFTCPIQFFYRNIVKITEKEENKFVDFDTFGQIIHATLNEAYSKYLDTKKTKNTFTRLTEAMVDDAMNNIDDLIANNFRALNLDYTYGKNYLYHEIIREYVMGQLLTDKDLAKNHQCGLLSLEQQVSCQIRLSDSSSVPIHGFIDRIESIDNVIRIMDYKTGSVDGNKLIRLTEKGLETLFDEKNMVDRDVQKIFQLLFYAFLFLRSQNHIDSVQVGIYAMKSVKKPNAYNAMVLPVTITETYLQPFIDMITHTIEEIKDPATPFAMNVQNNSCKTFMGICKYYRCCYK